MIVSGNELAVTVIKACLGQGLSRGVAEDMGKACVALEQANASGLTELVSIISGSSSSSVFQQNDGAWDCESVECAQGTLSMVDLAVADGKAKASRCSAPNLVLGAALSAQADYGLKIECSTGDDGWCEIGHALKTGNLKAHSALALRLSKVPADASILKPIHGLSVPDEHWATLSKYAAQILVPADDTNRADAGAGLTDND